MVAKWLDRKGVVWDNNPSAIPYEFNGKSRLYIPDFYLSEIDCYIEVKGYERNPDLNVAKWSAVDKPIFILRQSSIKHIENNPSIDSILIEAVRFTRP